MLYTDKDMAWVPGPREHFVYNAVGHTVALTDHAGNATQTSVYQAFGETVVKTGASGGPQEQFAVHRAGAEAG